MSDIQDIRAAGRFLVRRLVKKRSIDDRDLCDGTRPSRERLAAAIWRHTAAGGSGGGRPTHLTESYLVGRGHQLVRDAAWQLADLGVLRIRHPAPSPAGDEPVLGYEFTDRGDRFLADGEPFGYRKVRFNCFDFGPASVWLLDLAATRGEVTLRAAMDEAERAGAAVVADDSGNRYGPGTNTFAWAFEAALWHHAVGCHVEPAGSARTPKPWKELLREGAPPTRPPADGPWPLRDLPFRLADGVDMNDVWHLGVVVGG